jgi:hypothetical protein
MSHKFVIVDHVIETPHEPLHLQIKINDNILIIIISSSK